MLLTLGTFLCGLCSQSLSTTITTTAISELCNISVSLAIMTRSPSHSDEKSTHFPHNFFCFCFHLVSMRVEVFGFLNVSVAMFSLLTDVRGAEANSPHLGMLSLYTFSPSSSGFLTCRQHRNHHTEQPRLHFWSDETCQSHLFPLKKPPPSNTELNPLAHTYSKASTLPSIELLNLSFWTSLSPLQMQDVDGCFSGLDDLRSPFWGNCQPPPLPHYLSQ